MILLKVQFQCLTEKPKKVQGPNEGDSAAQKERDRKRKLRRNINKMRVNTS